MFSDTVLTEVRDRFCHIDTCPWQGKRVFFENAGGALTLKTVVETSARLAAIPDNQGRDNVASKHLVELIDTAKGDIRTLFGVTRGTVFVGESGTELLFRLIRTACCGSPAHGRILGSTLEHPATRSAAAHWAALCEREHHLIAHDDQTGSVDASAYADAVTPDTRVATILHTSPVTGMSVDVRAVVDAIRAQSPDCYIIVDGIQHAAHGALSIDEYDIDGYVISPYKVFSRHGYGVAWVSDRLSALTHERLAGTPSEQWEFGTRDTAAYATMSDVVGYFDWLGALLSNATDPRARMLVAGQAIIAQERYLVQCLLHGVDGLAGLAEMPGNHIIGGVDNARREGLVSFYRDDMSAAQIVEHLNRDGIRTHVRKADHYSANILDPLGVDSCVRVSLCHYNSPGEVAAMLRSMRSLIG